MTEDNLEFTEDMSEDDLAFIEEMKRKVEYRLGVPRDKVTVYHLEGENGNTIPCIGYNPSECTLEPHEDLSGYVE